MRPCVRFLFCIVLLNLAGCGIPFSEEEIAKQEARLLEPYSVKGKKDGLSGLPDRDMEVTAPVALLHSSHNSLKSWDKADSISTAKTIVLVRKADTTTPTLLAFDRDTGGYRGSSVVEGGDFGAAIKQALERDTGWSWKFTANELRSLQKKYRMESGSEMVGDIVTPALLMASPNRITLLPDDHQATSMSNLKTVIIMSVNNESTGRIYIAPGKDHREERKVTIGVTAYNVETGKLLGTKSVSQVSDSRGNPRSPKIVKTLEPYFKKSYD